MGNDPVGRLTVRTGTTYSTSTRLATSTTTTRTTAIGVVPIARTYGYRAVRSTVTSCECTARRVVSRPHGQNNKLELHPVKTKVYPISKGIGFLGFNFRLTETGKVLMHVKTDSVKRAKRRLKKLVDRCKEGLMTRKDVDECFESWLAHIRKGNSYLLEQRMTEYYRSLWRD